MSVAARALDARSNCRGHCQSSACQVGDQNVILGLSGGVDSSVVAALLARAIGDQLTCVFVDNGLLRFEEANQVMNMMTHASNNALDINVVKVDASETFLRGLEGVTDPEAKRKVIGNTFIKFSTPKRKK